MSLTLLLASHAHAQLAELVLELDQGFLPLESTAIVGDYVEVASGGRLFFTARTPDTGWEVWTTDGTSPGTRILGDLCPDRCRVLEPPDLVPLPDRVVWIARLGGETSRPEELALWTSDGTPAGTEILLTTQEAALTPVSGAPLEGVFVFATFGELWRTDGTGAGTFRLLPSILGASDFVRVGDDLFFLSQDGLGRTDGTVAGTELINDLNDLRQPQDLRFNGERLFIADVSFAVGGTNLLWTSPADGSDFRVVPGLSGSIGRFRGMPKVVGENVFVTTSRVLEGEELWRTDGTLEGTQRITDFANPHPFNDLTGDRIQVIGDQVLLAAREDPDMPFNTVWTTDGTVAGFRRLMNCSASGECPALVDGTRLHRVGDRVVFPVVGRECPQRIITTRGTPAATRAIEGVLGGRCVSNLDNAQKIEDTLYFFADDGRTTVQLWKTDGTPAGTEAVTDPATAPRAQRPPGRWIAPTPRGLVFSQASFASGAAPWLADIDSGQARPLLELDPIRTDTVSLRHISLGERTVFSVPPMSRFDPPFEQVVPASLWSSGGTAATTEPLAVAADLDPLDLRSPALDLAFFTEADGEGGPTSLRSTDGTLAGTRDLASFEGNDNGLLQGPVELDGNAYFWARDAGKLELWRTDGSAAGTAPVMELNSEAVGPFPAASGGLIFFETEEVLNPRQARSRLWATDGTAIGTRVLQDFDLRDPGFFFFGFVEVEGSVLFLAEASAGGLGNTFELWRTDGEPGGTFPVTSTRYLAPANPENLFLYRGEGYFLSNGLWKTDGTEAGTVQVISTPLSPDLRCEGPGKVLGDRLYFPLYDRATGCELWVSDGTTQGSHPLADLHRGLGSSAPDELIVTQETLFFTANDGTHGREVWRTDGTEDGTRLVHDLWPGGESSLPALLARADEGLFFFADDGLRGRELWKIPGQTADACHASATALCLKDGRFRVEAEWKDFRSRRGTGHARPLTSDTGTFWFFDEENLEVMLKVLDGGPVNGHFWTFFGALSNVQYWLTVTDSQTGLARRYFNPSRTFASIGDTRSFGPLGASLTSAPESLAAVPAPLSTVLESHRKTTLGEVCVSSPTTLCLGEGRFAVEATFSDFQGGGGTASAVPLTDDTGTFSFFRESNLELVVKVLDGQAVNGNFWVFFGSLSNVDFDLEVTDTATGRTRTYQNRSRRFASVGDTEAFPGP